MSEKINGWFTVISYIALATFAGAIGHIMRQSAENKPIGVWRVVIEALGAGLVGYLIMLICQAMELGPQWTGVAVGVCGGLGASASMRILERYVFRKLGVTDDDFDRIDRLSGAVENGRYAPQTSAVDRVRDAGDGDCDQCDGYKSPKSGRSDGVEEPGSDERF